MNEGALKHCKISRHMTRVRCIQNMAEAEELFGVKAMECNSCPCEQGIAVRRNLKNPETIEANEKEEDMANTMGMCVNCERPDMMVDKSSGLCGSCKTACAGQSGEAKVQALAKAREKFKGKPKMLRGKHKRKADEKMERKPRGEKVKKPDKETKVKTVVAANPPWAPAPSYVDIAIKIPFTKRFVNIGRLTIGGR